MFKGKIQEALICFAHPRVTLKYPFEPLEPPEGFRGRIAVEVERCIGCGGCANVCPSRLIRFYDEGDRTRMEFILDRCTYCGRCADVCPENAVTMTKEFETATDDLRDLYIVQELYMGTCNRCGRCFETENWIDKIPTRRHREGARFLGPATPHTEPIQEVRR
jgi:hydrogenase-4 component H